MTTAVAHLRARLNQQEPDRGSISLFVAVSAVGLILIIGLVVDGGAKLAALNQAQAAAQEAARSGADAVNAGQAISGNGITIDREAAQRAAATYLDQAGVTGTVSWGSDGSIVVDTAATYHPMFLPTGTSTVTGHASAKLIVQGG